MFSRRRWPSSATAATLTSCEAISLLVFRKGQSANCLLGIRRSHESLADQDRVHPHSLQLLDLLTGADPGLRDDRLPGRHVGQQVESRLDVDGEVVEVAVVDP